ncbi:hypothetical protein F4803DRAFT_532865 [Xylaria telfairii]|nr:hypothetical protein F4803DRAFT_532865 [Xylaria telfairii]
MSQPAKRIRLDDDVQQISSRPQPNYRHMISELPNEALRHMLNSLAVTSPSVQHAITSYHEELMDFRQQVLDFDQYSKEAWHVLNTSEYTRGSGSKQYHASWDAKSEVQECITAIGKQTLAESSYGTKLSALETLRKIAKTVLLAGDTLGREVRQQFQDENCIADEMLRIVQLMSPGEQLRAGATADAKGSLAEKVRWVCNKMDAYCMQGSEDLHVVLDLLLGKSAEIGGQHTAPGGCNPHAFNPTTQTFAPSNGMNPVQVPIYNMAVPPSGSPQVSPPYMSYVGLSSTVQPQPHMGGGLGYVMGRQSSSNPLPVYHTSQHIPQHPPANLPQLPNRPGIPPRGREQHSEDDE